MPGLSAGQKFAQEQDSTPAVNDRAITRKEYFNGELCRDFHGINLSLENAENNLELDGDLVNAARDALGVAQALLIKALA